VFHSNLSPFHCSNVTFQTSHDAFDERLTAIQLDAGRFHSPGTTFHRADGLFLGRTNAFQSWRWTFQQPEWRYESRNTTIGSTLVARRAGT